MSFFTSFDGFYNNFDEDDKDLKNLVVKIAFFPLRNCDAVEGLSKSHV